MIDILLHFGASMGITCLLLFLLLAKTPRIRRVAPRFWQSEREFRNRVIALVFAFSIAVAFFFAVGKEWLDGLGFGDVEFRDILADVIGVWAGTFYMLRKIHGGKEIRRTLTFRSRSNAPQSRPDFFVPPPKWDDPNKP